MRKNKTFTLILVVSVLLVLTGCTNPTVDTVIPSPTGTVSDTVEETTAPAVKVSPVTANTGSTRALLEDLVVAPEHSAKYYVRDDFKHWITQANGCDTRQNVLAREVINGTRKGCDSNGTWVSIYNNVTVTDPGKLDIDHLVPLKEAYVSGAYAWDNETRKAYANDTDYVYSLIAVTYSSNRSKGDKDPANWTPPTMDACDYVGRWVAVKHRWKLTVDTAEKDKILSILTWCNGDYILPDVPTTMNVTTDTNVNLPVEEEPTIIPTPTDGNDPKFNYCSEVKKNGYGPYVKGKDLEYEWYKDRDGDGVVCE